MGRQPYVWYTSHLESPINTTTGQINSKTNPKVKSGQGSGMNTDKAEKLDAVLSLGVKKSRC